MRWLAFLVFLVVLGGAFLVARRDPPAPDPGTEVSSPQEAGFVGSETCKSCHDEKHLAWLDTAHAYSLRKADETTVAGRFDGKTIKHTHFAVTPYRRDGKYFMKVERSDWLGPGDHEVTRIVGRSFEQAYLTTGANGEWRVLPLCWSLERGEWDLTHNVLGDISGHVASVMQDWDSRTYVFNHGCGQCHATDYDVGHELREDGQSVYRSTFLEGAVACESCHGPGSVHVAWHEPEEPPPGEYKSPARLVHPADDLDAKAILDTCGRCHYTHEWRYAIADDPLVSHHDIAITNNTLKNGFFADGRLSGMNYHGSTQSQSACYVRGGMSCLSCHKLHGRRKWAMKWEEDSDAQCTQCHDDVAEQEEKHTFHKPDDTRCVDCHMPRFLDGVLHFMRDHSIRVPEPEPTARFGAEQSPNACNVCHADRDAVWAQQHKEKWWGPAPRDLVRNVEAMVALRTDPSPVPTKRFVSIAEDRSSGIFFRLSAMRYLSARADDESLAALRRLLADPHPEIVQVACEAAAHHPDDKAVAPLLPLLEHEYRTIRVEAAYALARAGWRGKSDAFVRALEDAMDMPDRQRQFLNLLTRIAFIADAQDNEAVFEDYAKRVARLALGGEWSREATEVLHRKARRLTDRGAHERALAMYGEVRRLYGKGIPPLLFVDSADSLAAVGRQPEALANWKILLTSLGEGSLLREVAKARMAALSGRLGAEAAAERLTELEKEIENTPGSQEFLRRVRWSLKVVRAALAR